jgi:carboxybiotin decarboxylase
MLDGDTVGLLLQGVTHVTPQSVIMIAVAGVLLYLGIARDYEPLLLLPIASGCILANLPLSPLIAEDGMLRVLYDMGIRNELFPLLIFIGIGALTDFGPLLENPRMVLLGAAGQFGIFLTLLLALALGFTRPEAASIGIIGAIDGPTSIYVSGILAPHLLGPITVAAYSYMALVPIIMPPIMRALTTEGERTIRMVTVKRSVSQTTKVLFPLVVIVVGGLIAPKGLPLLGTIMLGNFMRESGVVARLTKASENEIANVVTLFLGLAIGGTMEGHAFLKPTTLAIFGMGFLAISLDVAAGVLFGKLVCKLTGGKVNPLIGAAGISAYPMAARVVQTEGLRYNKKNHLLMHAAGANTGGQIGSVIAAAVMLSVLKGMGLI